MHDIGFSYEFFPPSNLIGERRFWRTLGCLEVMDPSFFSITYGALGSGQSHSITAIENVVAESEIPVAAHLTFEGSTIEENQSGCPSIERDWCRPHCCAAW